MVHQHYIAKPFLRCMKKELFVNLVFDCVINILDIVAECQVSTADHGKDLKDLVRSMFVLYACWECQDDTPMRSEFVKKIGDFLTEKNWTSLVENHSTGNIKRTYAISDLVSVLQNTQELVTSHLKFANPNIFPSNLVIDCLGHFELLNQRLAGATPKRDTILAEVRANYVKIWKNLSLLKID